MSDDAEWIKEATRKISGALGGGSELFSRSGEDFRLDIDFACGRINHMRERYSQALKRAVRAEKALDEKEQAND